MNINRTLKLASVLLIVMVLTVAVYAFAAANTFASPDNNAGDGSQVISGYNISNVHYVLEVGNPANIASVTFTTAPSIPATGAAHVKLVSTGNTYTSCTISGANVTCPFATSVSVVSANEFRVIIAQ